MTHLIKTITGILFAIALASQASAETYQIDTKGMHASISFKIQHLGYSWLRGRFNKFSGSFAFYQDKPQTNWVKVEIDPASIDSNHALRDKHLRGANFLDVDVYDTATFESTAYNADPAGGAGAFILQGKLTLRDISKPIVIKGRQVGAGKDPWGGFRRGFSGTTEIRLKDFGITRNLGPKSQTVMLELHIEGVLKR